MLGRRAHSRYSHIGENILVGEINWCPMEIEISRRVDEIPAIYGRNLQ